eukprot:6201067-Pleurochrysis_carterae.AAC.2
MGESTCISVRTHAHFARKHAPASPHTPLRARHAPTCTHTHAHTPSRARHAPAPADQVLNTIVPSCYFAFKSDGGVRFDTAWYSTGASVVIAGIVGDILVITLGIELGRRARTRARAHAHAHVHAAGDDDAAVAQAQAHARRGHAHERALARTRSHACSHAHAPTLPR